jgi:hypothetical protein
MKFTLSLNLSDLDFSPAESWQRAFDAACGRGKNGSVIRVMWGDVPAVLKMIIGSNGDTAGTTAEAFSEEVLVLAFVRDRMDANKADATAESVGIRHLCKIFGSGSLQDARQILPTKVRDSVPLFYFAMEPLDGGLLWDRLGLPQRWDAPPPSVSMCFCTSIYGPPSLGV